MNSLPALLERLPLVTVDGVWHRHVAIKRRDSLGGAARYGRWSTDKGFPVLYLGQPTDSVVVEAYRHIVDPVMPDTPDEQASFLANLLPRVLVDCSVHVTNLLDLRAPLARGNAGLTMSDLTSSTTDEDAYARCQRVAQVAHQLRRHGIVTPSATGLGETLILFMDILPEHERPVRLGDTTWTSWPSDPRVPAPSRLRIVDETS